VGEKDFFQLSTGDMRIAAEEFRQVADDFKSMLVGAADDLRVTPWLGEREPVSTWAAGQFNQHFDQFTQRLTELGQQHQRFADSLLRTQQNYVTADQDATDHLDK
jgi:hypothetical protein